MQASVLSLLAPLMRALFKVCANGCIPNLNFSAALQNQLAAQAIFHTGQEAVAWCQNAGMKIRMAATKFRDMAMDPDVLERCLRKAWALHKKIVWATLEPLGVYRIFRIWGI